jgi:PAS domain S-box-containing protein
MASENPEAIVTVLDHTGRVMETSPTSETLLGYQASERVGEPSLKFVCPSDIDHATLAFQDALLTGESVVFGFTFCTKSGGRLTVRCVLYALHDPHTDEFFVLAKSVPDGRE